MPATVKATLKADARQDRTHAVRIRITSDRKPRYHNTGIYVLSSQWNPKGTYEKENWIKGHPEAGLYNRTIKKLVQEYMALALEHPNEDAEQLIRLKNQPEAADVDFLQFFRKEMERVKATQSSRTYKRQNSLYNKLLTYSGGSLPLPQLTVSFVRNFITWMQSELKEGDKVTKAANAPATVKKEVQTLSRLATLAIQEGLMPLAANPFPFIKVKGGGKKKDRLTPEQLKQFAEFPVPASKPRMQVVKDTFLLQYYLHGARVSDVIELTHSSLEPDRINYIMRKTGKLKSVKRSGSLDAILARYPETPGNPFVLPYLSKQDLDLSKAEYLLKIEAKTALINKYLKEFAKLAGLDIKISSHVARHTFADIARKKVTDIHTLKNMLAHSSIKITEIYISDLDQGAMDEATEAVYD